MFNPFNKTEPQPTSLYNGTNDQLNDDLASIASYICMKYDQEWLETLLQAQVPQMTHTRLILTANLAMTMGYMNSLVIIDEDSVAVHNHLEAQINEIVNNMINEHTNPEVLN